MDTIDRIEAVLSYDPATGIFRWKVWRGGKAKAGAIAGSLDSAGYRQIQVDGKLWSAGRLAWLFMKREIPEFEIDHKDKNRDNARWANLRLATRQQN